MAVSKKTGHPIKTSWLTIILICGYFMAIRYPANRLSRCGPVFRSNYNPRPDNINLRGNHGIPGRDLCFRSVALCKCTWNANAEFSQVWQFGTTGVGP